MAQNKCPLCGSRVINGCCPECGYSIPDEASIAAPYNYDPSDYNIDEEKYSPAEKEKSSMPEIRVYDKPAEAEKKPAPEINVGDRGGAYPAPRNNAGTYSGANTGGTNTASGQNANPYANFDPTRSNGANTAPKQNANPYANFNPTENQGGKYVSQNGTGKMSGQAIVSLIVGIIATLIWPVFGIIYIIAMVKNYNKTKDNSYKTAMWVLIAVVVFRFILFIGGFIG